VLECPAAKFAAHGGADQVRGYLPAGQAAGLNGRLDMSYHSFAHPAGVPR